MVPYEEWHMDYVTPQQYCLKNGGGKCTLTDYNVPRDAKVFRAQPVEGEKRPSSLIDPDVKVKYLKKGSNLFQVDSEFKPFSAKDEKMRK